MYGTLTHCGVPFQNTSTTHQLCNSAQDLVLLDSGPTTPNRQPHQGIAPARFRLFPFRSPLLRESLLFSFPRGTEMFQFPRFPPPGLCVQPGVTGHLPLPGFPIRRSTDRSLVGGSPWLIAATHVLHRHLAPRHPPLALCSLESSRCSCSLCSSQGAGASRRAHAVSARRVPGTSSSPQGPTTPVPLGPLRTAERARASNTNSARRVPKLQRANGGCLGARCR